MKFSTRFQKKSKAALAAVKRLTSKSGETITATSPHNPEMPRSLQEPLQDSSFETQHPPRLTFHEPTIETTQPIRKRSFKTTPYSLRRCCRSSLESSSQGIDTRRDVCDGLQQTHFTSPPPTPIHCSRKGFGLIGKVFSCDSSPLVKPMIEKLKHHGLPNESFFNAVLKCIGNKPTIVTHSEAILALLRPCKAEIITLPCPPAKTAMKCMDKKLSIVTHSEATLSLLRSCKSKTTLPPCSSGSLSTTSDFNARLEFLPANATVAFAPSTHASITLSRPLSLCTKRLTLLANDPCNDIHQLCQQAFFESSLLDM
ncbi:hypothetical protein BDF14DRAFT_1885754 [Spinellus fusiger]|nr:hypothetical protein BDF14DRAFT_1885754 [Spinellus fusiger]